MGPMLSLLATYHRVLPLGWLSLRTEADRCLWGRPLAVFSVEQVRVDIYLSRDLGEGLVGGAWGVSFGWGIVLVYPAAVAKTSDVPEGNARPDFLQVSLENG